MSELRFDNRVAVITGAGRGLGRAYALLLAARGARIVVNDPGVSLTGEGTGEAPADAVVAEIRAAGGEAVANRDSIGTPQGGQSLIETARDAFGRVDILIHNAGIVRRGSLRELSHADWQAVLDVHLNGGFNVLRPAFPMMCEAGYGRIVLTASINAFYGNAGVANYSAAKAGLVALANVAALEGAACGVKANTIVPAAVTRMSEGVDTSQFPKMEPDMVAPVVAYLAHETCAVSGEHWVSAAGRVAKVVAAETPGAYDTNWTPEKVAARADDIGAEAASVVFPPVPTGHLDHLRYAFAMAARG